MTIDEIRFVESLNLARESEISWDRIVDLVAQTWGKEDSGGAARMLAMAQGEDRPLAVTGCRLPPDSAGHRSAGVLLSGSLSRPIPVQEARGLAIGLLLNADVSETLVAIEEYLSRGKDKELGKRLINGITAHVIKARNAGLASWLSKAFPARPDGPPLQKPPGESSQDASQDEM